MRIAFFIDQFPTLSETFILQQITGAIDRGHEVDIFTDRPGNLAKIHPAVDKYKLLARTHYTQIPSNIFWRAISGIKLLVTSLRSASEKEIKKYKFNCSKYGEYAEFLKPLYIINSFRDKPHYDIIHCHYGRNGLKAIMLKDAGIIKGKIIIAFHGNDMSQYLKIHGDDVYNYLFDRADLLQPISEHWQNKLIALGCSKDKIAIHHMGIDLNKFAVASRPHNSERKVRLVSVARLVPKKGLEYGIKAIAEVVKTNHQIEYQIIGDGVLKTRLQQLVRELNLQQTVKLLGWKEQQEVAKIIAESDIMLAPSITDDKGNCEGIPVAMMEAMAIALPLISTYHSGIPELVEDGVSGYLVKEREVTELAEKICLLVDNRELRLKMGLAGRQKVAKDFNIQILNDRLVEIYRELRDDTRSMSE